MALSSSVMVASLKIDFTKGTIAEISEMCEDVLWGKNDDSVKHYFYFMANYRSGLIDKTVFFSVTMQLIMCKML